MNEYFKKVSPVFEKIKKDKKALALVIFAFLGMVLVLFSPSSSKKEVTEEKTSYSVTSEKLSEELESFLSNIEGIGRVKVMVSFYSTEEKVFALDEKEKQDIEEKTAEREHIIIEGEKGEGGLIKKVIYPKVAGVAVVCEGGDNFKVREQVISLSSALFSIGTNKISVAKMK